jgi:hypothetical protein
LEQRFQFRFCRRQIFNRKACPQSDDDILRPEPSGTPAKPLAGHAFDPVPVDGLRKRFAAHHDSEPCPADLVCRG